jgi:small subunit ribosomal protein S8
MMTDPLADMLARIRNGSTARHAEVGCPSSKLKHSVAKVLQKEGFLGGVRVEARRGHPTLLLSLRYNDEGCPLIDGLRRVSKPGRRVYVEARKVPSVRKGLGIAVLSTSKGVLSDRDAREASVGGEVLFEVW